MKTRKYWTRGREDGREDCTRGRVHKSGPVTLSQWTPQLEGGKSMSVTRVRSEI